MFCRIKAAAVVRLTASGCIDDKTTIACFAVFVSRKNAAFSGRRRNSPTGSYVSLYLRIRQVQEIVASEILGYLKGRTPHGEKLLMRFPATLLLWRRSGVKWHVHSCQAASQLNNERRTSNNEFRSIKGEPHLNP